MKLVAIIGSPRKKGYCFSVIKALEGAFNRRQPTTIDYVFLDDLALDYCKSCFLCMKKTETLCPHKAVTLPLYEKMQEADAVILASPLRMKISGFEKNYPSDYEYWKSRDWFHADYFTSAPIRWWKLLLAEDIERFMRKSYRKHALITKIS